MSHIFIVEDDNDIREMESYALESNGYEVSAFESGRAFHQAIAQTTPDLVLLDIMLPDEDGLSILRALRADGRTASVPIIMVTAKTTETDKVRGLDMGADDYLAKPFGIMELVSRVKALLRRSAITLPEVKGATYTYQEIALNDDKHRVEVDGEMIELTYKEFELLKQLLMQQGSVLTREQLMETVWGFQFAGETRTVDMHIKTLRHKLGDAGRLIETVRNVGYRLGE